MNVVVLYLLLLQATVTSFSGLTSIPLVRNELVVQRAVLTDEQLNSSLAIGQTTPGPVGLYVVIVGYFVDGIPGAVAGVLAAPIYSVNPQMGSNLIIVVFAVVVIGGMGSIMGSIVTGLALGLLEGLTKVIYPEASSVIIFVIMAIVLLLRPAGLFGKEK